MGLSYENLTPEVRSHMVSEIDADVAAKKISLSAWLNSVGVQEWPVILRLAADQHSDDWLAREVVRRGCFNTHIQKKKPSGGTSLAKVPYNAGEVLAEIEFNNYFIRGLCIFAIENNIQSLVVYRAKDVENPRSESEAKIGTHCDPGAILRDLRSSIGFAAILGLPPGPGTGITLRLP